MHCAFPCPSPDLNDICKDMHENALLGPCVRSRAYSQREQLVLPFAEDGHDLLWSDYTHLAQRLDRSLCMGPSGWPVKANSLMLHCIVYH